MTYKAVYGMAPSYINEMLMSAHSVHNRNTRLSTRNGFHLPSIKTETGRRTFKYSATVMWDFLPDFIRDSPSINSFKKRYMRYLKINSYSKDHFWLDM